MLSGKQHCVLNHIEMNLTAVTECSNFLINAASGTLFLSFLFFIPSIYYWLFFIIIGQNVCLFWIKETLQHEMFGRSENRQIERAQNGKKTKNTARSDVMMPLRIVFSQRNNLVHLFQHAFRWLCLLPTHNSHYSVLQKNNPI